MNDGLPYWDSGHLFPEHVHSLLFELDHREWDDAKFGFGSGVRITVGETESYCNRMRHTYMNAIIAYFALAVRLGRYPERHEITIDQYKSIG